MNTRRAHMAPRRKVKQTKNKGLRRVENSRFDGLALSGRAKTATGHPALPFSAKSHIHNPGSELTNKGDCDEKGRFSVFISNLR
ncbi:hypothetical protein EVAR_59076_1 [Eumeta japonica]|uniref:Uncharacterized protein n=1 Tax=Eumeta variegata TaxID=151549 RepID=A0A4C1Z1I4_EUMVA|nr:hypothetical protein EVAR_59076_1 [Eumeta japonica]